MFCFATPAFFAGCDFGGGGVIYTNKNLTTATTEQIYI